MDLKTNQVKKGENTILREFDSEIEIFFFFFKKFEPGNQPEKDTFKFRFNTPVVRTPFWEEALIKVCNTYFKNYFRQKLL